MRNKPEDKELEEMILPDMGVKNPYLFHKIIKSRNKIHVKWVELGKKDTTKKESYALWVKERVKEVKILFLIKYHANLLYLLLSLS